MAAKVDLSNVQTILGNIRKRTVSRQYTQQEWDELKARIIETYRILRTKACLIKYLVPLPPGEGKGAGTATTPTSATTESKTASGEEPETKGPKTAAQCEADAKDFVTKATPVLLPLAPPPETSVGTCPLVQWGKRSEDVITEGKKQKVEVPQCDWAPEAKRPPQKREAAVEAPEGEESKTPAQQAMKGACAERLWQAAWYYPMPSGASLFAIGDVHGDYEVFAKLMLDVTQVASAETVPWGDDGKVRTSKVDMRWVAESGTVVVLTGDLLDRYRPGSIDEDVTAGTSEELWIWENLAELQEQAEEQGSHLIVLAGNHELMNLDMGMVPIEEEQRTEDQQDLVASVLAYLRPLKEAASRQRVRERIGQLAVGGALWAAMRRCRLRVGVRVGPYVFVHGGVPAFGPIEGRTADLCALKAAMGTAAATPCAPKGPQEQTTPPSDTARQALLSLLEAQPQTSVLSACNDWLWLRYFSGWELSTALVTRMEFLQGTLMALLWDRGAVQAGRDCAEVAEAVRAVVRPPDLRSCDAAARDDQPPSLRPDDTTALRLLVGHTGYMTNPNGGWMPLGLARDPTSTRRLVVSDKELRRDSRRDAPAIDELTHAQKRAESDVLSSLERGIRFDCFVQAEAAGETVIKQQPPEGKEEKGGNETSWQWRIPLLDALMSLAFKQQPPEGREEKDGNEKSWQWRIARLDAFMSRAFDEEENIGETTPSELFGRRPQALELLNSTGHFRVLIASEGVRRLWLPRSRYHREGFPSKGVRDSWESTLSVKPDPQAPAA